MKIIIFLFISSLTLFSQPSYKIWSVVNTTNINENDTVIFDIGLSGNGRIDSKYLKLTLYGDVTSKIFIKGIIDPLEILVLTFPPKFQEKIDSLFISTDSVTLKSDGSRITINNHFSIVPQKSGDKTIKVIATYSADGKLWHTEESFINFHVNTWYEKWETILVTIGLIFAFIAILDPISNVYLKIKKKFFQKPELNNNVRKKQK